MAEDDGTGPRRRGPGIRGEAAGPDAGRRRLRAAGRARPGLVLVLACAWVVGPAMGLRAETHRVQMRSASVDGSELMVFEPAFLKIALGDTVRFVPVDQGHNSASVYSPFRGPRWSGEIDAEVTVVFDREGVYLYQCAPHAILGMVGVIQVGAPGSLDGVLRAAERLKKRIQTHAERVDRLLEQVEP